MRRTRSNGPACGEKVRKRTLWWVVGGWVVVALTPKINSGWLPLSPLIGGSMCCVNHVYHGSQLHTAHRPRPPPATERGERALAARGAR